MSLETIERQFQVPIPARLSLTNIRGSVIIQPGEAGNLGTGTISVKAVKRLDSGNSDRTRIEIYQEADGAVTAETLFDETGWFSLGLGLKKPCKVDYTVSVPNGCSVKLGCVSSSASIQGLEGMFDLHTVSGALSVRQLTGPLEIHSVSGAISGEGLAGKARLDTVSGEVRISASILVDVNASSVSGAVRIETPLSEGPYSFKSVSGEVVLSVPLQTACTVRAHSNSGRFRNELPAASHQTQQAQGGPLVWFESVSGNLTLTPVELNSPTPAQREPSSDSNFQILEKIAQGELTVEEGLKALKSQD